MLRSVISPQAIPKAADQIVPSLTNRPIRYISHAKNTWQRRERQIRKWGLAVAQFSLLGSQFPKQVSIEGRGQAPVLGLD
jgi:hypothetical protein